MKTFCFKLYKSDKNSALEKQINTAGLIYNHCIALHKRYYKIFGKYLKKNFLQKHLVKLKKLKKFSYLKEIDAQSLQDITDRIDRALFWREFIKNPSINAKIFISNLHVSFALSTRKFSSRT